MFHMKDVCLFEECVCYVHLNSVCIDKIKKYYLETYGNTTKHTFKHCLANGKIRFFWQNKVFFNTEIVMRVTITFLMKDVVRC